MMTRYLAVAIALLGACVDQSPEPATPDSVSDGKADGAGSLPAACGGTTVHTSTIPDYSVLAPKLYEPLRVVTTLGRVWKGSVSFELDAYACYDTYGGIHGAAWSVIDGANHTVPFTSPHQQFRGVTLPVTIKAAGVSETGYYPANICQPGAMIKNIRFETIGTSCLPGVSVRDLFLPSSTRDISYALGEDFEPTTVTFSAEAKLFDNYTVPECHDVRIGSPQYVDDFIVLTAASPSSAGDVTFHTPVWVGSNTECVSSQLDPRESPDADFEVTFSTIVLGPPGG